MNCNLCDGKGTITITRFGRDSTDYCYVCEGMGKVENCDTCNGIGETAVKENENYKFTPCLICMGHGVKPKQEKCGCNGKGYIWVCSNDRGDPFYHQEPCSCWDENMEE